RSRPFRARQARPAHAARHRAYRSRCRIPRQQGFLADVTPRAYVIGQQPPDNPSLNFPTTQEKQSMTTPDNLRYVEGELNYLVPMAERPRYLAYDAGPDAPPSNMAHEAHTVRIHDVRPILSEVTLDRYGFAR